MNNRAIWSVWAAAITALYCGVILGDFGEKQPAYTVGWSHLVTILSMAGIYLWCGYQIGKGDE